MRSWWSKREIEGKKKIFGSNYKEKKMGGLGEEKRVDI